MRPDAMENLHDVNTALIDLYGRIGEIISRKIETAG